ncbi:MAG: hypothetical protein GEU75_15620 [Dehalococcoidia bacterium]|nr:hypothetical protein [Dehalococcoidia bacterium]
MPTALETYEPPLLVSESATPQAQAEPPFWRRHAYGLAVASAVALGIIIRAAHVLSSAFPLNDGGLFYTMAQDLQQAGYRLPAFTSYNAADIPFSYPPLGFYAAALLDGLTPLSLVDVFRFLPLVATCLTLPAFYFLARSMLGQRLAVVAAVFAFALIPRSFIWLLMGGGITRSLGLLFAILALHQAHMLYTKHKPIFVASTAVLAGLTVLSHLETGWFLAFSLALMFAFYGRNRQGVVASSIVVVATLAITAPWWLAVIDRHGIDPFLAAQATGGSVFSDGETREEVFLGVARFVSTSEPLFPIIGSLALLGMLVSVMRRQLLLPVWWVLIILLDVRAFPTFTAIPIAMLAGIGVVEVLLPLLNRSLVAAREGAPEYLRSDGVAARRWTRRQQEWLPRLVLASIMVYATFSALTRTDGLGGEAPLLVGLSDEERAAMSWVAKETPEDGRFLVVPDTGWETAKTAEWFPYLAKRVSVATVQGQEWLRGNAFTAMVRAHEQALECGYRTSSCLDAWSVETGLEFSHVYIGKGEHGQCCWTLHDSLEQDPRYQVIYDGPGATIFARLETRLEPSELATR